MELALTLSDGLSDAEPAAHMERRRIEIRPI
jgi:hypothetical protein